MDFYFLNSSNSVFSLKIKYQNKTIKVEGEIPVTDLQDGILFINVFDKSKLILNSAVTLL